MERYAHIPEELKKLNQWVCIHSGSKVPMKAFEPEAASSTDRDSWSDYDTAVEAVSLGYYDDIGFVFADGGLIGIDIDDGFDEDGLMSPLAADIIGHCRSYTERSRSGRGFHIILKGNLPFKGRNNRNGVEIYRGSRYFIMTGKSLLYLDILHNQEAIDYIVQTYFKEDIRERENGISHDPRIYSPVWEKWKGNRIPVTPIYPIIKEGGRNLSLTSLAGSMHNIGYTRKQIYEELCRVNEIACKPKLPKNEIQGIVNSIGRYKR